MPVDEKDRRKTVKKLKRAQEKHALLLQKVTQSRAKLEKRKGKLHMDDGYLDVAIYDEMTKTDLLRHFMSVSNGRANPYPKVKYHRARQVRISANQEMQANSDKDVIPGKRTLEIEILPQALTIIAGKGIGLTLPVEAAPAAPPLTGSQPENANNGNATEKQIVETA